MYSASRVDKATTIWDFDCQCTGPAVGLGRSGLRPKDPPKKMHPPTDLRSAICPTQSESVNPISFETGTAAIWPLEPACGKVSLRLHVSFRYRRARLATVRCIVSGAELYRLSTVTQNAISGRVPNAAYMREPTIARYCLTSAT